jgi:hypothetical protein
MGRHLDEGLRGRTAQVFKGGLAFINTAMLLIWQLLTALTGDGARRFAEQPINCRRKDPGRTHFHPNSADFQQVNQTTFAGSPSQPVQSPPVHMRRTLKAARYRGVSAIWVSLRVGNSVTEAPFRPLVSEATFWCLVFRRAKKARWRSIIDAKPSHSVPTSWRAHATPCSPYASRSRRRSSNSALLISPRA